DANLATGRLALSNNTTGWGNTATGYSALDYNSNGIHNTATGAYALYNNSSGAFNTAAGFVALESNTTGNDNVGMGWGALQNNTSGFFNVGIGSYSLRDGTGSGNIGIGYRAGFYPLGNNNIHIGHEGYTSDNSTTRIGQLQGAAYMAGVYGAPLAGTSAHPVYVDNYGKFGVGGPSSIRFKEDVEDLGERSSALMELRPVSFHFKQGEGASETSSKSWGLIAEEVAQVFPELVTYDDEGKPNGVRYYLLTPLLLNEFQKQQRKAEALEHELEEVRARLARLEGSRGAGPSDR
ncbi:MAG TPA: tail fiber domain-containing protein, partial [Vicinamibacteria bacterium]|nr:tail fiber domain-containing protein [Vicinamibacteria bacterium]